MLKLTMLTCLTINITMALASHAAEYYVAMDGDDTNPGTLSLPWRTIAKASATLQPGDTVYIRAGIYREIIRPNRSGTEGEYITYSRYKNEEATITEVHDGADLSDRSYITFDGLRIINVRHWWVSMTPNSTHNIIRNCHMEEAGGWAGLHITEGSDYNRVLNNTLIGKNGPGDLIWLIDSSYNLIEGNDFHYGTHQCVDIQSRKGKARWNVVRNNVVQNLWHTGLAAYPNADRTLMEGNIILDCGRDHKENESGSERDRNMPRRNHKGIQLGSQWCIIRNNVLVNNGSMSVNVYGQKKGLNNRVYHNVFYDNEIGVHTNTRDSVYGNFYKNNVFFRNREYEISVEIGGERKDNYFVGNNILGASVRYLSDPMSLSEAQAQYQQHFIDNISLDPEFVDVDNRDFRLRPDSPMIDKAVFLTRTTSSGQGKVIGVEDANYFTDGWGIIEGDLIQLQDESQSVRVVAIDYESNLITVDQNVSWREGVGVSLAYRGSAPDIGVHEYGASE